MTQSRPTGRTASYPDRKRRRSSRHEAEHLKLAREVQRRLLPPPVMHLPGLELALGYMPSDSLGGDFCDYFPLEKDSFGLYLGDVQGKGIGAALYALLVTGTLRGIHKTSLPPADVLCTLNQRVALRRLPDRFSCLGYAVFELESRRLLFSNAGVPFPLLLRKGKVSRLELTGLPVGMFEVSFYDQLTVDLKPGDRLLFYSDGLPESLAPARRKVPDGQRKLERLFARIGNGTAEEILQGLRAKLEGNGKRTRRLRDDATFIVIKIT